MTVRERLLASRLVQKIDNNREYANQIGLSYTAVMIGNNKKPVLKKEVKKDKKEIDL